MKLDKKSFLVVFSVLFIFWLLLSTIFDMPHVILGIICSAFLAYFYGDLLASRGARVLLGAKVLIKFIAYGFWLVVQIFLANIDVARRVLDPKLPISPRIIKYESKLSGDIARTAMANSITLTPGTLTVDVLNGDYYVHCLAEVHADRLKKGTLREKVLRVFSA